ncbi:MAG: bifunctional phosphopantothenoylcysteine decarboxylase/phosphopantothenate--cysteine ligase CoaBC [Candidatus Njordarchaeales archaeon]
MEKQHPSKDIKNSKSTRLKGKEVILAVTSSAAIYKAIDLARELMRHGAEIYTVMSPEASKLISPKLFHWATGNPVLTELTGEIEHIKWTFNCSNKLILVAPATANTISKIAMGIADNALLTVVLAGMGRGIPTIIVPAMHLSLWKSPQVVENIKKLREIGITIVEPLVKEGKAKFPSIEEIVEYVFKVFTRQNLRGKRVLVTGGGTRVYIDKIRFISNPSSGKMGIALALEAWLRGAETTLIISKDAVKRTIIPRGINVLTFETYDEAKELILKEIKYADIFLHAAAISDFRPDKTFDGKIESDRSLSLRLIPTEKIIKIARDINDNALFVAFKAEWNKTNDQLIMAGKEYLGQGMADIVIVNDVSKGIFGADYTEVILLARERGCDVIREMRGLKRDVAGWILDYIAEKFLE